MKKRKRFVALGVFFFTGSASHKFQQGKKRQGLQTQCISYIGTTTHTAADSGQGYGDREQGKIGIVCTWR